MIYKRAIVWCVHVFTASGLLAGFMAVLAINARDWRTAMFWLLIALLIDSIDGTLARMFRAREVLPHIDGKMIDTVVDFVNYAVVPAYFFYGVELAGSWNLPLAFLILLVSAVYYGKDGMVSEDFYFVGFPVMWNVVIFYLVFIFSMPAWGNAAIIIIFSVLHFVPVKFAYPSRATRLRVPTMVATSALFAVMVFCVWLYPQVPGYLKWIAVGNLAYFGVLAEYDTLRAKRVGP